MLLADNFVRYSVPTTVSGLRPRTFSVMKRFIFESFLILIRKYIPNPLSTLAC